MGGLPGGNFFRSQQQPGVRTWSARVKVCACSCVCKAKCVISGRIGTRFRLVQSQRCNLYLITQPRITPAKEDRRPAGNRGQEAFSAVLRSMDKAPMRHPKGWQTLCRSKYSHPAKDSFGIGTDKSHVSFVRAFYLQIARDTPNIGQVNSGEKRFEITRQAWNISRIRRIANDKKQDKTD